MCAHSIFLEYIGIVRDVYIGYVTVFHVGETIYPKMLLIKVYQGPIDDVVI